MKEKRSKQDADEEKRKHDLEEDILTVQEATKISDGMHTGKITNVVHENREGFDYIDLYVVMTDDNGKEVTIKTGFPAYISQNSSFGRFLVNAGFEFKPKDTIKLPTIKEELIGKVMTFTTYTEDNFARVVNKTIKF